MNKLLVIDNLEFFLMLVKSLLDNRGCTILTATNAEDAFKIIEKEKLQLILLDRNVPHMSGDDLCSILKKTPQTKDIPLIMLLTSNEKEHIDKCFEAGGDDYIIKPVDKEGLLNKISKYIPLVKRAFERVPIYEDVKYSHEGVEYSGYIQVIGKGGACLRGEHMLPVGSVVRLEFSIDKLHVFIDVIGKVVWNSRPGEEGTDEESSSQEMGVQFMNISEKNKNAIVRYMAFSDLSN